MQNIIVGRYQHPTTRKYYQGWLEPDDKSWIAFIRADGVPEFYLDRDPTSGAVGDLMMEQRANADCLVRNEADDPLE